MSRKQKLMYKCMACDTVLSYIGTCRDNLLKCPECDSTHLVSFDGIELKTVIRFSKQAAATAAFNAVSGGV